MLRKLHSMIAVLLVLLILIGCDGNAAQKSTESVPPATESVTEPVETTAPKMDAESLYWKGLYATGGKRASQYTMSQKMNMRIGTSGVYMRTNMSVTTQVALSADPYAVNVEMEVFYSTMDLEVEQNIQTYYRVENDQLVGYIFAENMDLWERQVLDMAPYDIIQQYGIGVYPSSLPKGLSIGEGTQMLGDHEAYILSYSVSGRDYFGVTGDTQIDAALDELQIPIVLYVDTETYLPLQLEIVMHDVDDLLSALLYNSMSGMVTEDIGEVEIQISEFSMIYTEMDYSSVEVPDIPEEGIQKAQQSAGYTTV